MKVLWFANTPCGATEKLTGEKVTGGGWLYALSDALKTNPNIELHIAFYWKEDMGAFMHEGITYHPVQEKSLYNRYDRYVYNLKLLFGKSEEDEAIAKLDSVVSEVEPDIIHVHGSEMNFGLIAERYPEKTVLSIQGLISPYLVKLFSGYPHHDIVKTDTLRQKLLFGGIDADLRRIKLRARNEQRMFKNLQHVIGRTDWDKSCSLALNPSRKYYVVNEILRQDFFFKEWQPHKKTDHIRLVTTVSNGFYKGVETIYRTAEVLKNAGIQFEWDVIGLAPSDYFVSLTERLEKKHHKNLNINMLGRKDATSMIDTLLASDLFIQVSHIENSPNSLCEAMLLGMPIIASYAGGTCSMLSNGEEGVLVQDGDPYVLAGKIMSTTSDYDKAIAMATNARKRALKRHDPQNVVVELLDVYNHILNNK